MTVKITKLLMIMTVMRVDDVGSRLVVFGCALTPY
jgi:hypothetical protein